MRQFARAVFIVFTVLRFGLDEVALSRFRQGWVRALVRVRLAEMSKPANGKWFDYYDDGTVKAAGSSKDGKPHGRWRWYRADGSLERTGQYKAGVPTGVWESWDADGVLTQSERR